MTWFRPLALVALGALVLLSLLGVAPTSTDVAVNIATVVLMIAVPFVPLAHLPFTGPQMVVASMVLAFVVALAAQLITGELKTSDLQGGAGALLLEFGKLWAIQQGVFQLFKDALPALTSKPILIPAPVAPAVPKA